MALFGRKKEVVPVELEPFYEQEPAWRIWLRRILAVAVLAALVAAIIWAAVTVYRQVTNNDIAVNNGSETSLQTDGSDGGTPASDDATTDDATGSGTNNTDDAAEGTVSDEAATTESEASTTDNTASTGDNDAAQTGSTGTGSSTELPHTGASELVVIMAIGVALIAAAGHHLHQRRQV